MTNSTVPSFGTPFQSSNIVEIIPPWFFVSELILYTLVGIKITYSTIIMYRKSQDWTQIKEMFTRPTIQSSIYFCMNAALKGCHGMKYVLINAARMLLFMLALAKKISPVIFFVMMLAPLIPLFYSYCLIIVFW